VRSRTFGAQSAPATAGDGAAPFSDVSGVGHTTTYLAAVCAIRECVSDASVWLPKITIPHSPNASTSAKTKPSSNNLTTIRCRFSATDFIGSDLSLLPLSRSRFAKGGSPRIAQMRDLLPMHFAYGRISETLFTHPPRRGVLRSPQWQATSKQRQEYAIWGMRLGTLRAYSYT
jgi:hypothetical protein